MRSKAAVVGSLQTRNKPDISSIAAILVVAMVILSMIPLYAIARYDVPSADDFQFRPDVIQEIITNNGILDCIQYILEVVKYYYNNWQGTYTVYFIVNFLMMLGFEPPDMYSLVPIVILSLFTIAFFAICWVVLHGCLKISAKGTIIIFGLLQFACVQCTPSIVEGFYWYSGAMMYTGFFSVWLISLAGMISLLNVERPRFCILRIATATLVAFAVGGTNYPTALLSALVYVLILGVLLYNSKKKALLFLFPALFSVGGLLLNVIAPGNTARIASEGVVYSSSLLRTIQISFLLGFQFIREWLSLPSIIMAGVAGCITVFALKKHRVRFRFPLIWTLFSLCMYCALYAPAAYSYGWIGPQRYMNVCYWGWILVLYSNAIYYGGWIAHKRLDAMHEDAAAKVIYTSIKANLKKYIFAGYALIVFALFVDSSYSFYTYDGAPAQRQYASIQASNYLKSGFGETYYAIYRSRLIALEDPNQTDPVFGAYPTWCRSPLLYFSDITTDEDAWMNIYMAEYYEKNSVKINAEE